MSEERTFEEIHAALLREWHALPLEKKRVECADIAAALGLEWQLRVTGEPDWSGKPYTDDELFDLARDAAHIGRFALGETEDDATTGEGSGAGSPI